MLEFDKKKYNDLREANNYSHEYIMDYLKNRGIEVKSLDTVKNWTRKAKSPTPGYEKVSALAELFGIPSLHLFVDGEKELEKNIKLELHFNPEKYRKYFEKQVKSEAYREIIEKLERMDNEKLGAVMTIIKNI